MQKTRHYRKDRLLKEKRHDVYREKAKLPEPTLCNNCGALFMNGRWSWNDAPDRVNQSVCPACRRISDNCPAGIVEIKGTFYKEHRNEILNLIHNTENQEKSKHALERIMKIKDHNDTTTVTTTGIHVARRIGEALSRSYKGDYNFQYGDAEKCIRVYWQR